MCALLRCECVRTALTLSGPPVKLDRLVRYAHGDAVAMSEHKESSVLFNLKELMGLEEERIQSEEGERQRRAEEEARRRAAEEARAKAEADARVRAEQEAK